MPLAIASSSNLRMRKHKTILAHLKANQKWKRRIVAVNTPPLLNRNPMKILKTKDLYNNKRIHKEVVKGKSEEHLRLEETLVLSKKSTEIKKLFAIAKKPNVLSYTVIALGSIKHVMGVIVLAAIISTFTMKREIMQLWH
jgi:hypothetical protein